MTTNGAANGLPSDADLASIAAALDVDRPDDHADNNLAEILVQLSNAESVAQRMEDNLDQLLERLDGMVEGLEAAQPAGKALVENDPSETNGTTESAAKSPKE